MKEGLLALGESAECMASNSVCGNCKMGCFAGPAVVPTLGRVSPQFQQGWLPALGDGFHCLPLGESREPCRSDASWPT